jgi:hypothetical protein
MIDHTTLKEGDTVTFMITGMACLYMGIVRKTKGYHDLPEIEVTHFRRSIHDEWADENLTFKGVVLKGEDYILDGGPR